MAAEPPSPSASSVLLPFLAARPRRGSLASITSRRELDRDALAEALDHIHGTASKSEALTSFHDFDGGAGKVGPGAKDLVSSGMSSLYNKLKTSVGQGSSPNRPDTRSGGRQSRGSDRALATPTKSNDAVKGSLKAQHAAGTAHQRSAAGRATFQEDKSPTITTSRSGVQRNTKSVSYSGSSSDSEAVIAKDKRAPRSPQVTPPKEDLRASSRLSNTSKEERAAPRSNAPARALQYNYMSPTSAAFQSSLNVISTTNGAAPLSRSPSQTTASSRSSATLQPNRPAMVHVGVSHLPGFNPSGLSSPTTEDPPTLSLPRLLTSQSLEPSPNINGALQRRRTGPKQDHTSAHSAGLPSHLKRRVISKEFWMKDENAKVCFDCGQSFSTFRRKHHCRTCGQIFDAKCTSLVSGVPFGQSGTLRLCKPCEDIIFGSNDDDSTVFSEDAEDAARRHSLIFEDELTPRNGVDRAALEQGGAATPTIGIPASRRNREAKRRSAVIEFDAQPTLTRPTSSRSLISLSGRPRSASHKRHPSRAQQFRSSKSSEYDAPFPQQYDEGDNRRTSLSVFHNDNVIDPDLAAYLSDEESEEEAHPNIMAALDGEADTTGRDKFSLSTLLTPTERRSRFRTSVRDDDDAASIVSKNMSRLGRRGTPSMSSLTGFRASPRHSRSHRYLRQSIDERHGSFGASPMTPHADCLNMERSATMQPCTAHSLDINQASYEHIRKLLVQMLNDASIDQPVVWEKALMPLLLRCTTDVNPDVPRGDDMDIRHYVKLKKVPGGRPGDTSYVSGVAFSKQIALKSMARSIRNPRIAIVTFSIEYARHQSHFMSLDPVIAQEREYLSNLVSRIAALKPHVLLVQRNVSGLALKLLEEAGITVAFNIKESVLAAVARVTKTTLIKSIDKLTLDPHHLGRCEGFSVKTYVHNRARRTYIVLSGCQPDLGCTIILRGAELPVLRAIKRVAEFMCFVVYNLRLEAHLMRDEFAAVPSTLTDQLAAIPLQDGSSPTTGLSFDLSTTSEFAAMERRGQSRALSASPFVVFMQPYLLTQLRSTEQKLAEYSRLKSIDTTADEKAEHEKKLPEQFELVQPEMVSTVSSGGRSKAVRDYLQAVHSAQYDRTSVTFEHQRRLWQAFLSDEADPFDPLSHQNIVVLHSVVSNATSAPCTGPELLGIGFYAGYNRADANLEEDCTLGQYVEDVCIGAGNTCKECSRKMIDHCRQYVHGQGQLAVSVARKPSRIPGMNAVILMWSVCKICQAETPIIPMSDSTWKYSFAKYLELSFWSRPLRARAKVCDHDLHKDFTRSFGFQDLVVQVQYDPIEIYDVVVPRPTVTWNVEADLTIKNAQYQLFEKRLNSFIESVRKRLSTINVDTLDEKQMIQAQETIETLRHRADHDHEELLAKLQDKYTCSKYYEWTPLNRALRFMDEKALNWDETFNNFEKDYFPSENDIRKLAAAQLKEMFYGSQSTTDSMISDISDDEGGSELAVLPSRPMSQQIVAEPLDDEKVDHVLSAMAQDQLPIVRAEDGLDDLNSVDPVDLRHEQPVQELSGHVDEPAAEDSLAGHAETSNVSLEGVDKNLSTKDSSTRVPAERSLAQRVDQLRSAAGVEGDQTFSVPDSKIPRLQSSRRREDAPHGPDVLATLRAQSSPHLPRASTATNHALDRSTKQTTDTDGPTLEKRLQDRIGRLSNKLGSFPPSLIPRSVPNKIENSPPSTVSALARHFEHLSREFEKERLRERRLRAAKSRQARANPLASSRPVVEVYKNATEAVGEPKTEIKPKVNQQEPLQVDDQVSIASEQLPHVIKDSTEQPSPSTSFGQADASMAQDVDSSAAGSQEQEVLPVGSQTDTATSAFSLSGESELEHADLAIPEHKRNVWFKVLSEFWSKRSASGWSNLEYPLHNTEHVFEDSDIIVREDEPSSVIALSLASADYLNKVKEFRSSVPATRKGQQSNEPAADELDDAVEASLLKDTGTHMKYSFSHGQVKASCKIFYAEAFDALRRRCGVSNRFVESMSRCMKFDSKGGKTKSLFLKTLDNRFIIKSLQEVEVKAFTKFAPDYFAFMSHTLFRGLPSVIAKMFGLFQIIVKNPATGMDFSYYLLVMENLFYDHTPNRRFDLKGSMRNRKIESTGQPDEVLLDENLVETIFESPLFVREHSRRLLQASVWNDTLWLCKQNVMDYSLMAGFEDDTRQLVVGIIDCIRTYTWDKKLESWIKDRGKNKPTITSPKDYRNRFRVSMMQYVLQAPNCWHQFQASMAPPKTLKEKDEAVPRSRTT